MKYKTIVIDPPWPVDFVKRKERPNQKSMPYSTMSLQEIYDFPINNYADDECALFLWTTQRFLHDSFHILDKWGFKYNSTLTWDKNDGMCMFGVRRRTEFVLFGYKGKINFFSSGTPIESFFYEKLKRNSEKPRIFYDMILKRFSEPRIDIFSRKKHFGFDSFGNEAEEPITLEQFSHHTSNE